MADKENDAWARATSQANKKTFADDAAKKAFIDAYALKEYRAFLESAIESYCGKLNNLPVFRSGFSNVVFHRQYTRHTSAVTELGRAACALLRCLLNPTHTPKSVIAVDAFLAKLDAAEDKTIKQTFEAFHQSPGVMEGIEIVMEHCYKGFGTIKRKARKS